MRDDRYRRMPVVNAKAQGENQSYLFHDPCPSQLRTNMSEMG
jgi:hypothetical protein